MRNFWTFRRAKSWHLTWSALIERIGMNRRFDCPAFLLTAEETGQTNRRIETEPIRRRTQQAFLKSRDSTKMFRRYDFRNARSVRP